MILYYDRYCLVDQSTVLLRTYMAMDYYTNLVALQGLGGASLHDALSPPNDSVISMPFSANSVGRSQLKW